MSARGGRSFARALAALALVAGVIAPARAVSPPDQYATFDRDSKVIEDTQTGLAWERFAPLVAEDWLSAVARCEALALEGKDDWRLPSYKELLTLVDENPHDEVTSGVVSAIWADPNAFFGTPPSYFWTGTSDARDAGQAWRVDFGRGDSSLERKTAPHYVRCVRDAVQR